MFEVGKTYICDGDTRFVYRCLGTHGTAGWMVLHDKEDADPLTYSWGYTWKEHRVPKVETLKRYIRTDRVGPYLSDSNSPHGPTILGTVVITFHDGKPVKSEIINV